MNDISKILQQAGFFNCGSGAGALVGFDSDSNYVLDVFFGDFMSAETCDDVSDVFGAGPKALATCISLNSKGFSRPYYTCVIFHCDVLRSIAWTFDLLQPLETGF